MNREDNLINSLGDLSAATIGKKRKDALTLSSQNMEHPTALKLVKALVNKY